MIDQIRPFAGFDYIQNSNPTIDVNPNAPGKTWLNMSTGEIFVCTDATIDSNIWKSASSIVSNIPSDFKDEILGNRFGTTKQAIEIKSELVALNNDNVFSNYLSFDGSTSFIELVSTWVITDLTMSFWVKSTSSATSGLISSYYSPSGHHIGVRYRDDNIYVFSDDDDSFQGIFNSATMNDNNWHHILAEFILSSSTLKVRIDNNTPAETTVTHSSNTLSNNLFIARDGFSESDGRYTGDIANLRFYERELLQSEIDSLYLEGSL